MSVRINGIGVVVRRSAIEASYPGGMDRYRADVANLSADDDLAAVTFSTRPEADAWVERLTERGVGAGEVAIVDGAAGRAVPVSWIEVDRVENGSDAVVRLRGHDRSEPAEPAPSSRFEILSRSDSGLSYVRERRGGRTRVLTESELEDFNDPPPCPKCAEQFGCDHFNCAGESLLSETEIEAEVPPEWMAFARDCGVSRQDLERLRSIERSEGEYRLVPEATSDVRMLELVLLLNEAL
jgi:hypothetical protein